MTTYLVEVEDLTEHSLLDAAISTGRDLYLGNGVMQTKVTKILKVHPEITWRKASVMAHVEADFPISPPEPIVREPRPTTGKTPDLYQVTMDPAQVLNVSRLAAVVDALLACGVLQPHQIGFPWYSEMESGRREDALERWLTS